MRRGMTYVLFTCTVVLLIVGVIVWPMRATTKAAAGTATARSAPGVGTEAEPNDTPATANPLPAFSPCAEISGGANPNPDTDFFSFSATAGQRIWAYAEPVSGTFGASALDLIGSDGSTVIETDSGDGNASPCDLSNESGGAPVIAGRVLLNAGTYYLKVTTSNDYRLSVVLTLPGDETPMSVPNDFEHANPIIPLGGQVGVRTRVPDVTFLDDFYSFQAKAGDLILIVLDTDPERDGTSTIMFILMTSPDGEIFFDAGSGTNNGFGAAALCFSPPGAGTYFVRVAGQAASVNGSYHLMVANCTSTFNCSVERGSFITVPSAPSQCSAIVSYSTPGTVGSCGPVTCAPPSGSPFPVGKSVVTCTASTGESSTFLVFVNDLQPPTLNCGANVTAKTTNINSSCAVVNYPLPSASDNCGSVVILCSPAPGSCLPVGVTEVTCLAYDAVFNHSQCSFAITVFNTCLQDDSNPGSVFMGNSLTGDYVICCAGTTFSGRAKVTKQATMIQFEDSSGNRRLLVRDDEALFKGTAALKSPPGVLKCAIVDRDSRNNNCVCP